MWAAVALALLPQGQPETMARFRDLDQGEQREVLAELQRQVRSDPDPTVQRIISMSLVSSPTAMTSSGLTFARAATAASADHFPAFGDMNSRIIPR